MSTDGLIIRKREDWFAQLPGYVPMLAHPASKVYCHFSRKQYTKGKSSPGPSPTTPQINEELLYLQRGDMFKYPDIRYNFMIAPNGVVYECRGWSYVPSLPFKFSRDSFKSIYVGFIGDFADDVPPKELFLAREKLIAYGIHIKCLSKKLTLISIAPPEWYKGDFTGYYNLPAR